MHDLTLAKFGGSSLGAASGILNCHQGVLKLVTDHQDLPQPLKTLEPYDMTVYVGRIQKKIQQNQLPFVVLGDNLGRGAAGAALANLTLFDRLYA